jgi:hypothetical protein
VIPKERLPVIVQPPLLGHQDTPSPFGPMLPLEHRAELQAPILGLRSQALQSIAARPLRQPDKLAELENINGQPDPTGGSSQPRPDPPGETFVRGRNRFPLHLPQVAASVKLVSILGRCLK